MQVFPLRSTALMALAAVVLSCVCGRLAGSQQSPALREADETFQARCSTCHAEHGEGSEVGASLNVPDLRSPRIQQQDDSALRRVIQEGKGDMPTFRRDFTDQEITQLIQLVRSFAEKNNEQNPPRTSQQKVIRATQ